MKRIPEHLSPKERSMVLFANYRAYALRNLQEDLEAMRISQLRGEWEAAQVACAQAEAKRRAGA